MLTEKIKELALRIADRITEDRRHLHRWPELSFCEYDTSAFVKNRLDELGIGWTPAAGTGVIAVIHGTKPGGKVIALRADMDALPIKETNNIEYASRNEGTMHACGHDAHTASLLGTAYILHKLKPMFAGKVILVFQPGEEKLPGGASLVVKEEIWKNLRTDAVIGQHVMPTIDTGKIGIRSGRVMASMDELQVTVYGKGGHGAIPHLTIDPVMITANILVALQQIVSRHADPTSPCVLSFGRVLADGAINIIPEKVSLEGTFRAMNEEWRKEAHRKMKKMAEGIAESMGGHCDFVIRKGYPVLNNTPGLTEQVTRLMKEYTDPGHVLEMDAMMISEDFAYYSQCTDSCFYFLGTKNTEKGTTAPLHSPSFNIDEDALETSAGLMAYLAVRLLGSI